MYIKIYDYGNNLLFVSNTNVRFSKTHESAPFFDCTHICKLKYVYIYVYMHIKIYDSGNICYVCHILM